MDSVYPIPLGISVYIVPHSQATKTFINWAIFKRKDSEGDDNFLT